MSLRQLLYCILWAYSVAAWLEINIFTYLYHTPALQTVATICSCNNTTAASTPTSTPSSLVSSTCGTNCHQTQWGLHRSICSRTDSPPSRCVKPLYWTMFYQHFTMHCFYQFLLMSSIFTQILSLAHLFYAYFTHGPNKSASAQYDNTRGAWLTQEGCTLTEREERGTIVFMSDGGK